MCLHKEKCNGDFMDLSGLFCNFFKACLASAALPELLRHAAVDCEVEGVGEVDTEVDHQNNILGNCVVHKLVQTKNTNKQLSYSLIQSDLQLIFGCVVG